MEDVVFAGACASSTPVQTECATFVADLGSNANRLLDQRTRPDEAEEPCRPCVPRTSGKGMSLPLTGTSSRRGPPALRCGRQVGRASSFVAGGRWNMVVGRRYGGC